MTPRVRGRRANGEGTIRKLPSGNYQWRLTLGKAPNGRQLTKCGTEPTRTAAAKALAAAITDRNRGLLPDMNVMTVEQWLRSWLPLARSKLAPTTHANYVHLAERHIYPVLGPVTLQGLKPSHVREFYTGLVEQGYSKSVLRQVRAILCGALHDALLDEIVHRNVAELAQLPQAKPEREGRALHATETQVFLAQARTHRLGVVFEVAVATGLRRGELCGLRWAFVDLELGTIQVRENLPVVGGRPTPGPLKTKTSLRDVPLAPETLALLQAHRARQIEERAALGLPFDPEGHVFTRPDGSRLNPDHLTKLTQTIARQAGLGSVRLHDLRHTNTSLLLRHRVPPEIVSRQLGHSRVEFTLNRYRHIFADEGRAHAIGLSDLLAPTPNAHGGTP
ncbi:site-specific integrase [Deinococcus aetherius]|uniref:Site-specific integrase n=1 Tax=Deinococcus aetherius TaxID=200252 RepID=A0ABM8AFJ8_9DEIO|nr:site-specific integrase [Deinococcus aetherius]BDP42586.1 site-specific integrase [Deinococcus aetherius]